MTQVKLYTLEPFERRQARENRFTRRRTIPSNIRVGGEKP